MCIVLFFVMFMAFNCPIIAALCLFQGYLHGAHTINYLLERSRVVGILCTLFHFANPWQTKKLKILHPISQQLACCLQFAAKAVFTWVKKRNSMPFKGEILV